MPADYSSGFLYMSDGSGCATEIINEARLAANLANSQLCGSRFGNIAANAGCDGLLYAPGLPPALMDPVFWIDAADAQPGDQYARNRGSGGSILNAIYGANTSVGTDEPLWLGGTEKYLYVPGVSGNNASTPNTAVLRLSVDFEILLRIAPDDWTPASAQSIVSKYTAGSDGWEVQLDAAGTISLIMRIAAANVTATSTAAPTVNDGQALWLRITRVSSTGVVTWYTAADQDNVPGAWGQLGNTVTSTTGAVTTGSTSFVMGERANNTQTFTGKIFRVITRSAVGAVTPVNGSDFNFTQNTSQTSFVATGGTVTINRSTNNRKAVAYMGRPLWLFGVDDFMSIPDAELLDFAASDSFTVLAVFRSHTDASAAGRIISKLPVSTGWELSWTPNVQHANLTVGDGATVLAAGANETVDVVRVVAGVRNQADTVGANAHSLRVYLNGIDNGSVADTTTGSLANSGAVAIGAVSGGGAFWMQFELMALAIWRRALTPTELSAVSTFYLSSLGPQSPTNWTPVDTSSTANPWYRADVPASAEAFGFMIEQWTGLDGQNVKRASYDAGQRQGGAYFGQATQGQRVMKLNVLLHGSTERGLTYLFQWLQQTLMNCCSPNCGTRQLWFRQYCPTNPATDPFDGMLRAERVVLLEGVQWEAAPVADGACFLRRVSFTLAAGDPCLYRENVQLTAPTSSTIAGVTITPTATASVLAGCGTWQGSNRRVQVDIPAPPFGSSAPIIVISSPLGTYTSGGTTARQTLPVMRITGYSDPLMTGDPCRATKIGEVIIEGVGFAGLTIYVDLAQRRVTYDDPLAGQFAIDGSGFVGSQVISGVTRWWTFDSCSSGFVVVEPVYATLDTVRSVGVTSGVRLVPSWTTTILYATRSGCC